MLNNGVTILTEKIETGEHLQVEVTDPQIVNGLQTSREIYNYYRDATSLAGSPLVPTLSANAASDNRRVLVKLIKTADTTVRDTVIRSTNSQNVMPEEALRATDPIHRQIETLFHRYNLFYDRRKGHYRDQGKPVAQIVSVLEVSQAMLSVVLRRPDDARGRPRDYFKKNDLYSSVFGKDKWNLNLYLKSVQILGMVGSFLDKQGIEAIHRRNLNFYMCMYVACAKTSSAYAPPPQVLAIDPQSLSEDFLKDCYDRVRKQYDKLADKLERDYDALAKGPQLLKVLSAELQKRFNPKKKKN